MNIIKKQVFVLLLSILIFHNIHADAVQNGTLPSGMLSVQGATIAQTKGEYYFVFVKNTHTIGDDTSYYSYYFDISLNISLYEVKNFTISFVFSTTFDGSGVVSIEGMNGLNSTDLTDKNVYKYTFNQLKASNFNGGMNITLTVYLTEPVYVIQGFERFAVVFTNETSHSVSLPQFRIKQIDYTTTMGLDNSPINVDIYPIIILLIVLPQVRRFKSKNI